jgi:hypothetical protein
MPSYVEPVSRLLTAGKPTTHSKWTGYYDLGIDASHVPELLRMMSDIRLNLADPESEEVWAPVHAARALAVLESMEAVEPFLALVAGLEDIHADAWVSADAPEFFATIGPATLPYLGSFLQDEQYSWHARATVAEAICNIAMLHPGSRQDAVDMLMGMLKQAATQPPELNAVMIWCLTDMKAVEATEVIEAAVLGGHVDESMAGMLENVQMELGLLEPYSALEVEPPADNDEMPSPFWAMEPHFHLQDQKKDKARAKKKVAPASKKRNRKG